MTLPKSVQKGKIEKTNDILDKVGFPNRQKEYNFEEVVDIIQTTAEVEREEMSKIHFRDTAVRAGLYTEQLKAKDKEIDRLMTENKELAIKWKEEQGEAPILRAKIRGLEEEMKRLRGREEEVYHNGVADGKED